jgi:hypothetical protein
VTGNLRLRIGCALPEAVPAASGRWMLPSDEEPSCRCLSPRVLARSRYDAHWLRQASDVQNTLEALATTA